MSDKIQNYINHFVYVIDRSGSMRGLEQQVVKVFDGQVAHLAKRSQELKQETRVSVYLFDDRIECLVYDMDVMRLPSLENHYDTRNSTALIAATIQAIEDLKLTPEIYADHAFVVYALTDGGENASHYLGKKAQDLRELTDTLLSKTNGNWSVACLVPDADCRRQAIGYGFPEHNTQIWNVNAEGITQVGENLKTANDNFMVNRAKGVRSSNSLFKIDASALNTKIVKQALDELTPAAFNLLSVRQEAEIRPFVERQTRKPYRKGSAFYQLTKAETVQNYKQLCVQDKKSGKVFGGDNARQLLGLPDFEVKVSPAQHDKYNIFVQSTSVNRKLVKGTNVLVLK